MRLHLILPRVEPEEIKPPSECPYEGCTGTRFRFLQEVEKPLRDTKYPQVVALIEEEQPDLVLLDIQMPGLDGFGVIEALEEPPPIVFVTAYDEYAIRAFEVNALDYLLKPFSRERLEQAIRRAQEELEGQDFALRLVSHCWRAWRAKAAI